MSKKPQYDESSGNVFADLGIENPEEALAKSELVRQIGRLIKKKKLTQKQAAEILGIDQPKISALIRGRLRSFSLERLIRDITSPTVLPFLTFYSFFLFWQLLIQHLWVWVTRVMKSPSILLSSLGCHLFLSQLGFIKGGNTLKIPPGHLFFSTIYYL